MAAQPQCLALVTEARAHSVQKSSALEASMTSQENILFFQIRVGSQVPLGLSRLYLLRLKLQVDAIPAWHFAWVLGTQFGSSHLSDC